MKLTLAMGLQFDNGKQGGMVALNLGGGKQPSMQAERQPVEANVLRALPVQDEQDPGKADGTLIHPSSMMPARKSEALIFLTYNLKGFNDTLVFEHALVDLYA